MVAGSPRRIVDQERLALPGLHETWMPAGSRAFSDDDELAIAETAAR